MRGVTRLFFPGGVPCIVPGIASQTALLIPFASPGQSEGKHEYTVHLFRAVTSVNTHWGENQGQCNSHMSEARQAHGSGFGE